MARKPSIEQGTCAIDELQIGQRFRAIDPARVAALVESIKQIGLKMPISVRLANTVDPFGDGHDYDMAHLVAGNHRVEAYKALGLEYIPCIYIDGDERDARLWEISENLHRAELLPVERAEHIDEWRRLTVAMTQQGAQLAHPSGGVQPNDRGHAKAAEALGVSRDTVSRAEKIAALPQETRDTARAEGWSQDRLLTEARGAKPVSIAPDPLNDFEITQKQVTALMSAWNKAGAEAREQFMERVDRPIMDRRHRA